MRERTCRFGPERELAGIISEPRQGLTASMPAVLLFNSGLLHRVGQNRLNVALARRLAERGFSVLRFDFSGLGDSLPRHDSLGVSQRHVEETRFAMDFLQATRQHKEFVLVGLCTGADNAHRVAIGDERVRGIVVIDGYAYPTTRSVVHRYAGRFPNWILRQLGLGEEEEADEPPSTLELLYTWELPDKDRLATELRGLIDRNMARLALFAGSNHSYAYPGQFADSFPELNFHGTLEEVSIPKADHTYSIVADRAAMVSRVVTWISGLYPEKPRLQDPAYQVGNEHTELRVARA